MDALLNYVKAYLEITWELDDASKNKLVGIIQSAQSYIARKAGVDEITYTGDETDHDALALLCDYVRYARAYALDEFENNYVHEIISLREKYGNGI